MASPVAKKAAGTYIADSVGTLPPSLAWLTQECRSGSLARYVEQFCAEQSEIVEQSAVLVESITADCIQCRIPCPCSDHEAAGTFVLDVRFNLNPASGVCRRI